MVYILLAVIILITTFQLVFLGSIIFLENRDPAKTIAWLLILGILPILGAAFYLVFGRSFKRYSKRLNRSWGQREENKIVARQREKLSTNEVLRSHRMLKETKLATILINDALAPLTTNNYTEILTNGEETFGALFKALEAAKEHIHLEYYIFKNDELGKDVLNILTRKAAEGVKVRVLVDGWGSRSLAKTLTQLRQKGVEAHFFLPVKFPYLSKSLNLRNHRKIVVVDGQLGFMGGLNIGDEYLSRSKQYGFWRDTFLKLKGEAVHSLQTIFLDDWYYATKQNVFSEEYFPVLPEVGDQLTQIAASGPDAQQGMISQVFFTAMTSAQKSIYIETPYLVLDDSTLMALKSAASSGLDVKILTQGVPDHKITYWASHSYFADLLASGVKIYVYEKGILHAKVLIVDGELGFVGSTNFDIRSFHLNFEVNCFVYSKEFAGRLNLDFTRDIENSEEVLLANFQQRHLFERWKESSARLLSPLL